MGPHSHLVRVPFSLSESPILTKTLINHNFMETQEFDFGFVKNYSVQKSE